jgi:D-amino-acid dehydrogenase
MSKRRISVVGAGTVGVCTGLYLLREGYDVTLIDKGQPGTGCSYGNAGLIQVGACVPIATGSVIRSVPRMLLNPDQPLVLRWQYLASLAPYLLRFLASATPSRVDEISRALASILQLSYDAYRPLIQMAAAHDLVRLTGELHVYETDAAYESAAFAYRLREERGVRLERLDRTQLLELEPALASIFRHAVYLLDPVKTADPFLFTSRLAEAFLRNGGRILRECVKDIHVGEQGGIQIASDLQSHDADAVVIATGAHSRKWASKFGNFVPLNTERGYHLMLPDPGLELRVPVLSGDYRFALTSMADGLRLAGTAELAKLDAKPDYRRARRLLKLAKRMVPDLTSKGGEAWMGQRPSTPDSLPVIGRSSNVASVYFAFGHGHLGLTLGAVTGMLIADMVAGRKTPIDVTPFRVSRFKKILPI